MFAKLPHYHTIKSKHLSFSTEKRSQCSVCLVHRANRLWYKIAEKGMFKQMKFFLVPGHTYIRPKPAIDH